jgi:hypothetical protein
MLRSDFTVEFATVSLNPFGEFRRDNVDSTKGHLAATSMLSLASKIA